MRVKAWACVRAGAGEGVVGGGGEEGGVWPEAPGPRGFTSGSGGGRCVPPEVTFRPLWSHCTRLATHTHTTHPHYTTCSPTPSTHTTPPVHPLPHHSSTHSHTYTTCPPTATSPTQPHTHHPPTATHHLPTATPPTPHHTHPSTNTTPHHTHPSTHTTRPTITTTHQPSGQQHRKAPSPPHTLLRRPLTCTFKTKPSRRRAALARRWAGVREGGAAEVEVRGCGLLVTLHSTVPCQTLPASSPAATPVLLVEPRPAAPPGGGRGPRVPPCPCGQHRRGGRGGGGSQSTSTCLPQGTPPLPPGAARFPPPPPPQHHPRHTSTTPATPTLYTSRPPQDVFCSSEPGRATTRPQARLCEETHPDLR